MAKLALTDITSGYALTTTTNANNALIEAALENTLSRDGTGPNQMEAALDMNSYAINNLPDAVSNQQPVTLAQAATIAGVTNPLTRETIGSTFYPQTSAEVSAGVTPTNYYYEPGDVRRYGAVLDGVTDDSTAFSDALSTGHDVYVPEGTMVVNSATTVSSSTKIRGAGVGKTIIDGTGISTTTDGVIAIKGTLTQREDPSSNISQFDKSITFASPPTFSDGQVGLIWNPTNSSYSGFRTNYYAGEFFRVQDVAAQLDLTSQLYAAYTAANVDIYSLDGVTASISNLSVYAPDNNTNAILLQHCIDSSITNVEARNSYDGAIQIDKCYNVAITGCTVLDRNDTDNAQDYALAIVNSQGITVSDCQLTARRHASTITGDAGTGAVVNREITISNVVARTFTDDGAVDMHGNSEFVTYMNCTINGGISSWGGNKNRMVGCSIYGQGGVAGGIAMSEVTGLDHTFANNYVESNGSGTATRGWAFDVGGNDTSTLTSDTGASGTLRILHNTFVNSATSSTSNQAVTLTNAGATVELNLEIVGNHFSSADAASGRWVIDSDSGNEWNNIVITDNTVSDGCFDVDCLHGFISRNIIHNGVDIAGQQGIELTITGNNGTANVHGNIVKSAADDGIYIDAGAVTGDVAYVSGNIVTGAGGTYSIRVTGPTTQYLLNNVADGTIRADTGTTAYAFGNSGPVSTNIATFAELGFDSSGYIIAPSLPTSTPGGSDRLWSNANVINIT